MALLNLFLKNNYNIVVVNFNHQSRKSASLDHELIKSVTSLHDVSYHYIKLSIKSGNFQAEARKERYRHLKELAIKYNTKYIVTSHHLDDLAETILIKLIRGSNLLGYSSMREITNKDDFIYLKPFLTYSKEDIIKYAKENNLKYNEDESNLSDKYLRNRIRHNVMPHLKKENNSLNNFLSFSKQTYLASKYIRKESILFLDNKLEFSLNKFNYLDETIKMDVLSLILERINIPKTYQKLEEIISQLNSNKPNINIKLSNFYYLVKSYDLVSLKKLNNIDFDISKFNLIISHKKDDMKDDSIILCYNKLDFPLSIRKRKEGDKLAFLYGHKLLKKYLIEKKVPLNNRNKLLLIVDANDNIIAIPNLYINKTLGDKNKLYINIKENNIA